MFFEGKFELNSAEQWSSRIEFGHPCMTTCMIYSMLRYVKQNSLFSVIIQNPMEKSY